MPARRTKPTRPTRSRSTSPDMEPGSSRNAYPLQRGTACLACRRRKMKCDGTKPVCTQCAKAGRGPDCEYDDGKTKTRTQLLQEKIALLEGKIRDLESIPQDNASSSSGGSHHSHLPAFGQALHANTPSAFFDDSAYPFDAALFALPNDVHSGLGGALVGSTSRPPAQRRQDPFIAPASDPWDMANLDLQMGQLIGSQPNLDAPWPTFSSPGLDVDRWWEQEELPSQMRDMLVNIFLPHARQCAWEVNPEQFKASLDLPEGQRPHRALLNAIYLNACHFSGVPAIVQHEPIFLERTRTALAEALEHSDRLVNYIQASCLLASYFLGKGRLLEGHHLIAATARLAVGCGLNRISANNASGSSAIGATAGVAASIQTGVLDAPATVSSSRASGRRQRDLLPTATTGLEVGERIYAFWMIYNLDRFWSIAVGLPTALVEDEVEVEWPKKLSDYENGPVFHDASSAVRPDSVDTLICKAVGLFESASRLHTYLNPDQPSEEFWNGFRLIQQSLIRLSCSLPPIRQIASGNSGQGPEGASTAGPSSLNTASGAPLPSLVLLHTLACAVAIQLHSIFALEDAACYAKCLEAARAANGVIRQNQDIDVTCCDPMLGPCWLLVAEVLIRELLRWKDLGDVERVKSVHIEVESVMYMMKRLGMIFPLVELQAQKVERSLASAIQGDA